MHRAYVLAPCSTGGPSTGGTRPKLPVSPSAQRLLTKARFGPNVVGAASRSESEKKLDRWTRVHEKQLPSVLHALNRANRNLGVPMHEVRWQAEVDIFYCIPIKNGPFMAINVGLA